MKEVEKKKRGRPPKAKRTYEIELAPEKAVKTNKPEIKSEDARLKNLTGRHSRYKPEYAETLDELYKQHETRMGVCVALKISKTTYDNWRNLYPDFQEAHERCECIKDKLLYDKLIAAYYDNKLNPAPIIFIARTVGGWKPPEGTEAEKQKERERLIEATLLTQDIMRKKYERDA